MHLQSALLKQVPGLKHGFGSRDENVPGELEPFWSQAHPTWKQVHGTGYSEILQPRQHCGETDALATFQTRLPVAVITADCVPVLLARRSGGAGAAIHAGWRGTYAGTVEQVLSWLRSRGEKLSEWVAAIGPAIGPCCYEVSEDLVHDFSRKFPELSPQLISPAFRKLDLPAIHQARLAACGLGAIDLIRACTFCSEARGAPLFHSYRREKDNSRQYSGLVFAP